VGYPTALCELLANLGTRFLENCHDKDISITPETKLEWAHTVQVAKIT